MQKWGVGIYQIILYFTTRPIYQHSDQCTNFIRSNHYNCTVKIFTVRWHALFVSDVWSPRTKNGTQNGNYVRKYRPQCASYYNIIYYNIRYMNNYLLLYLCVLYWQNIWIDDTWLIVLLIWLSSNVNPYHAELFLYKPWRHKGFFSIWSMYKCLSWLFLVHLNTYVMGLRPLEICWFFQRGDRLYTSASESSTDVRFWVKRLNTSESDVYRRQILTY